MRLDPETLLSAYAQGIFPMTDRDGKTRWYTADPRGVIPLDGFHAPQTLRQLMRRDPPAFELRIDNDFPATMRNCMMTRPDATWISDELIAAYSELHRMGFAHSVEMWKDGRMVGGLYGVNLGAAFFGESMFHHEPNASKVALVHLVQHLRDRNFELLDAQASTPHLRRFGCIDIPAEEYLERLRQAITRHRSFT